MDPSPKRKHDVLTEALHDEDGLIDRFTKESTPTTRNDVGCAERGCDSPRSAVAEHMQQLNIHRHVETEESPTKKTKLSNLSLHETPHQIKRLESRQRSCSPLLDESSASRERADTNTSKRRYRSPPLSLDCIRNSLNEDVNEPLPIALTWQVSDITGMELDVSAGDDGEGLNGVGFRPTTQTAYARKQKRKQQLSDWKVREAKEARQKRFERRQGCHLHNSEGIRDRSVRFAEML